MAFAVFRDLFVFTSHRLLLVDKQGMSGKKDIMGVQQAPARHVLAH